jgi:hypothetical protein
VPALQHKDRFELIDDPRVIAKIQKNRAEMEAQFQSKVNKGRAGTVMRVHGGIKNKLWHFILITSDDASVRDWTGGKTPGSEPTGDHQVVVWRYASENFQHSMDVYNTFQLMFDK